MTDLEGEIVQTDEGLVMDRKPNIVTKYLGTVFEGISEDITKERIIAGREIESWKRDCWPWHMFSDGSGCTKKNLISGSLGFLDFTRYNLSALRNSKVDFEYFGNDALIISTLGIEPSGSTRLRKILEGTGVDPSTIVGESMIEYLRKIAKERNIPIIGIEPGSLYNFYPGICTDRSLESTQQVYGSIGNFQRFKDKKGNPLDKLGKLCDRMFLTLYEVVN